MKKTIITTICLLFVAFAYAQNNNERYEYCAFRVNRGFSEGALTTDFVFSKELMTEGLREASKEKFYSKDIVFDVQFISSEDGAIIRVFHLVEVTADDLKAMFSEIAGSMDYVIAPSEPYKIHPNSVD